MRAASAVVRTHFNGQPALALRTASGASALLSEHGAQLLSWMPQDGEECLYLSPQASFDGASAIRGGVPVCFPQFARRGPLPAHGFARNLRWTVEEERSGADFALVILSLSADERTRALWPHEFRAELSVLIEDRRLEIELEVENRDAAAFEFTAALHTYLAVGEVEYSQLEGLHGHQFEDSTAGDAANGNLQRDSGDVLRVEAEVDRIYRDVGRALLLRTPQRNIGIHAEGFPDVVVWNPWEARSRALADLPDDGFRRLLCVEAAAAHRPLRIDAGKRWVGRQSLVAL